MNNSNIVRLAAIFVVALLLQVVVLDNLDIVRLCNPFVYIVFILSLPFGVSPVMTMFFALPAGLVVDIASNTPGMHTAACVLIAYLRRPILNLIAFRSAYREDDMPTLYSYGLVWFVKYTVLMVSIHHILLFFVEQFDSLSLAPTLIRILLSIIASTFVILLFELILPNDRRDTDN